MILDIKKANMQIDFFEKKKTEDFQKYKEKKQVDIKQLKNKIGDLT